MTTRAKMVALVVAAGMLGGASSGKAGTKTIELDCWTMGASSSFSWASFDTDETASTTKTQGAGYAFNSTDGAGQVIECSFHVPADYDDTSADEPEILLSGWTKDDDSCSATEYVKFAVTSRAYGGGEVLTAAWPTEAVATFSFTCITNGCGVGINCNRADVLHHVNVDATASAADWTVDELVFVKIRRDTPNDDVAQTFHLDRVALTYPAP